MIRIAKQPFLGPKATVYIDDLKERLNTTMFGSHWYFITLSDIPDAIIEMTPIWVFEQFYYKQQDITVYGIAYDREEAIAVITKIILDCYKDTGTVTVSVSYLKGRCFQ